MKIVISCAAIALALIPATAKAQQYVYPVYSQNAAILTPYASNYQPQNSYAVNTYAQNTYTQNAPTQITASTSTTTQSVSQGVVPLTTSGASAAPVNNAAPAASASDYNSYNGYGTASYGTPTLTVASAQAPVAAPSYAAVPAPVPSFTAVPTSYATPSPTQYSPAYNWTGCYGGAYIGGAFGDNANANELSSQGGSFVQGTTYNNSNSAYGYGVGESFLGGGTLGCNYHIPLRAGLLTGIVLGGEGEGGSLSLGGNGIDPNSGVVDRDTKDKTTIGNWDAIAAGRIGAAFDRFLVYGKFGAVFTNVNSSITDGCTTTPCGHGTINAYRSKQITDAAIGGGLEYALSNKWSVKGEYMYLDTSDSYQVCGAGGGTAAGSNFCSQHTLNGTHTVKVGLNYHFNDMLGSRTGPQW